MTVNQRNARWTEEEEAMLRSMAEAGKSITLITAKLKRPINGIKSHAQDLGIRLPGTDIGARINRGRR